MKKRILVIEDEADLKELMKLVLRAEGYEVEAYNSGDTIIQGNYTFPDLYIIDVNLPGYSGLKLCSHIKQQETLKHIPVVMISANTELLELAKDACADASIAKPLNKESLLKNVNLFLKQA